MKNRKFAHLTFLFMLMMASWACNLPVVSGADPTAMAQAVAAELTKAAPTQTSKVMVITQLVTTSPTATLQTEESPLQQTQIPPQDVCNAIQFIADVNYPDNTEVTKGTSFVKTWRLKNNGTCTWTNQYKLVFMQGDRMAAPDALPLTQVNIPPGGTVDVSVKLNAPTSSGTYQGFFRLQAADYTIFGLGTDVTSSFWVKIIVVDPIVEEIPPTAVSHQPDLIISDITLVPAIPTHFTDTTVKVSVYNQGAFPANEFAVYWWGLNTFDNPSCTWKIDDPIVAHGGRVYTCTFQYASPYPGTRYTKAQVDVTNHVIESNEGNNVYQKEITVN